MRKGKIKAKRYHDFSMGHRVHGHESKCAHLHGHNYRVHFEVQAKETSIGDSHNKQGLDEIGRVMDFSVIKFALCEWLEDNWDHKFLVSQEDPMGDTLIKLDPDGVVEVPFNPTAENMAMHLVKVVGPVMLENTGVELVSVEIEETRKCSASFEL